MNVTLYNTPNDNWPTIVQYLYNRNIPLDEVQTYLSTDINDISPAEMLGERALERGLQMIASAVAAEEDMWLVVDCDVDGYCASALFINYMYDLFPAYTQNHIKWTHHTGKQHGLNDVLNEAKKYKYVVCLDSSSNDYEAHEELRKQGTQILIADHHEAPHIPADVVSFLNNQLSDYPNKAFCGCGVTWLFCKYIDKRLGKNYADNYLDLVAVSNQSDMMNGTSAETKAAIFEGLKDKNINNPFVYGMIDKNAYSFSKADYKPSYENGLKVSPMGVSFFLTPMVNAICRSGTLEEKQLIFDAMLKFKAYTYVLSTKRGHKLGETEQIITQALRTATNVKNRQERIVTSTMEHLECLIAERDLLRHKILLFLLQPGEVDSGVAGLVANKLMAKYQRCCAVLTRGIENEVEVYRGSMRAYSASGLDNFKDICENSRGCLWAMGHQSAAGLCLSASQITEFLEDTDKALADLPDEVSYHVDYAWTEDSIDGDRILDIANLNEYIMTDLPRSFVYVKDINVTDTNLTIMKGNTVKIITKSNISIIAFGMEEEEINNLIGHKISIVARCNSNQWNGTTSPQLILENYQIVGDVATIDSWGF